MVSSRCSHKKRSSRYSYKRVKKGGGIFSSIFKKSVPNMKKMASNQKIINNPKLKKLASNQKLQDAVMNRISGCPVCPVCRCRCKR